MAHAPGLKNNGVPTGVGDDSRAALEREASAAIATAPAPEIPEPGAGIAPAEVGPSEEEILAGYALVCGQVVGACTSAIVPAWEVTAAENGKLSGAMARALLLWFPDQIIPPKYLSLLVVAGVGFEIINARRDPQTGRLRPARLEPPRGETVAADTSAPDPHAPPN